jgi:hypothetical protein
MKTSSSLGCMLPAESVSPVKGLVNAQRRLLARFAGQMRSAFGDDEAKRGMNAMPPAEPVPLNLAERRQVDLALRQWIHQQEEGAKTP